MPVEIRELQITTVVNESASAATSAASSSATPASTNTDAIISACVEQVLEILKEKNER
jgi:hypothetical protein